MATRGLPRILAAFQASLLVLSLFIPALATAATIQTDLWVYQDGDTVTVTGVEFGANETVDFVTTDPVGTVVDTGSADTDELGNVTYAFVLHATMGGIYDVVATGRASGLTAATQFDPQSITISGSDPNDAARVWHTSTSSFDIVVSGSTSCTGGSNGCVALNSVAVSIYSSDSVSNAFAAGNLLRTKAATLTGGGNWTVTFEFRASWAGTQVAIPATDRRFDVRAVGTFTLGNNATTTAADLSDEHAGFDAGAPGSVVTAVTGSASGVTASVTASDPAGGSGFKNGNPKDVQVEIRSSSCSGAPVGGSRQEYNAGTITYTAPAGGYPTAPGTYYVVSWATDLAGNVQVGVGCMAYTIASPNTPPVLVLPPSPVVEEATSAAGAVVNYIVTASDAEDNPDPTPTCAPASGSTFAIGDTTVSCSVTDLGGMTATGSFVVRVVDTTDPTVSISTAESIDGSWYNIGSNDAFAGLTIDVTVGDLVGVASLSCTDNGSDVGALSAVGGSFVIGDGVHAIVCIATDAAANSASDTESFSVDQTAPSVTVAIDDTPSGAGWFNSTVHFTASGTDATSDIASCTDPADYSGPDTLGTTVQGSCVDNAGNVGYDDSDTFKYDATAPSVTVAVSVGTLGNNLWYLTNVTVHTSGTDGTSGISSCDADQYQLVDTTGTSYSGSCTDNAGNVGLGGPLTVKRDATAPLVQITSPADGSTTIASSITVSGTDSDATSGIESVKVNGVDATLGSGTFSRIAVPISCGVNTVTALATDEAGNTASDSITVTKLCFGIQYQSPIDQSTTAPVVNVGKYGRVIPVKVAITLNGVAQTDANLAAYGLSLQMGVNGATCATGAVTDTVEAYADAGMSSSGTNLFRWDASSGKWIYNLDTKAPPGVAMVINSCYRLDAYVNDGLGNKVLVSSTPYALFKPVK